MMGFIAMTAKKPSRIVIVCCVVHCSAFRLGVCFFRCCNYTSAYIHYATTYSIYL